MQYDFDKMTGAEAYFTVGPILSNALLPNLDLKGSMAHAKCIKEDGQLYFQVDIYKFPPEVRAEFQDNDKKMQKWLDDQLRPIFGEAFPRKGIFGGSRRLRREWGADPWYTLVIPLKEAFTALEHSSDQRVKFLMDLQMKTETQIEASSLSPGKKRQEEPRLFWQKLLSGKTIGEGTYFSTRDLKKLADISVNEAIQRLNPQLGGQKILDGLKGKPELAKAVGDTIAALGFRRIAYLGQGNSTLAFSGIEDEDGRQQLILVTPLKEDRMPFPLLLPEIAKQKILVDGADTGLIARVMPALEMVDSVRREDFDLLNELTVKAGLRPLIGGSGNEVSRHDNVGIYTYRDQSGASRRLPVILDWGSIIPLPRGQWPELEARCRDMEELKPWYAMEEYIRSKGITNVMPHERLEKMEQHSTGRIAGLVRKGHYPF